MNPWLNLPRTPPYVLPEDAAVFAEPKFKDEGYRFDAFPDPFIGNLSTARVIFLSLNPGFKEEDITVNLSNKFFVQEAWKNLSHESNAPFMYLMDELKETFGYQWWHELLEKSVRDEGLKYEVIRERIGVIEYMPYHSETYTPNRLVVPSQLYAFGLVRQAIKDGRYIVIMRNVRAWVKAVPELADYPYIRLNSQRPFITRGNMTKYNSPETIDDFFEQLR